MSNTVLVTASAGSGGSPIQNAIELDDISSSGSGSIITNSERSQLQDQPPQTRTVLQTTHGFSVGLLVVSTEVDGTWVLASALSRDLSSGVALVISVEDTDNFIVQYSGFFEGLSSLTPGQEAYLSTTVPGQVQVTVPVDGGQYIRNLYTALTTTSILLHDSAPREVILAAGTVKSDWEEVDTNADNYIENKPVTITTDQVTQLTKVRENDQEINQLHSFVIGSVVMRFGSQYLPAQANDATSSRVVGIVTAVADSNNFTLTLNGFSQELSGLTPGATYYLSATAAGTFTETPVVEGQYSCRVLTAITPTTCIIHDNIAQEVPVPYSSSIEETTDTPNTYVVGNVVTTKKTLAQSSSETTLGAGIIDTIVDTSTYTYKTTGEMELTDAQWQAVSDDGESLQAGEFYYVSSDNAGKLTKTIPGVGNYDNPLGYARTAEVFIVLPWRPTSIVAPEQNLLKNFVHYGYDGQSSLVITGTDWKIPSTIEYMDTLNNFDISSATYTADKDQKVWVMMEVQGNNNTPTDSNDHDRTFAYSIDSGVVTPLTKTRLPYERTTAVSDYKQFSGSGYIDLLQGQTLELYLGALGTNLQEVIFANVIIEEKSLNTYVSAGSLEAKTLNRLSVGFSGDRSGSSTVAYVLDKVNHQEGVELSSNANGHISGLKAGKTYLVRLNAQCETITNTLTVNIKDIVTGSTLHASAGMGVSFSSATITMYYKPLQDTQLGVFFGAGTNIENPLTNNTTFLIEEVPTHTVNFPGEGSIDTDSTLSSIAEDVVPSAAAAKGYVDVSLDELVNDQTANGYIDIGKMRVQWGQSSEVVSSGSIVLPVPFATASYSLVGSMIDNSTDNLYSVHFSSHTATGFNYTKLAHADITNQLVDAVTPNFDWIAIGLNI